jgi:glycosyltransferase involved in cell wall biosynthesis
MVGKSVVRCQLSARNRLRRTIATRRQDITLPLVDPTAACTADDIDAGRLAILGLLLTDPFACGRCRPHPSYTRRAPVVDSTSELSFVIPAMDEQETLATLHAEILRVCQSLGRTAQIVFVDDGSSDGSWEVISRLVAQHPGTDAIRFRRNFGKAAALQAGFSICRGELVFTMDADLQDDPDEIPRFLDKLNQGFDVVSGWKRVRHDPWHKVLPSRVFNWLVSSLTGVRLHDHNCGFKAYRRQIFDEVQLYGERHRFVPVLAAARGWKVGEIEVEHHARKFGRSKYGVSRILKGFLDLLTIYLLTSYSSRPLHLIGAGGLLCFAIGGFGILYLTVMWVVTRMVEGMEPLNLHERAIFYYCIFAVLLGAQALLAGLLAELIVSRTATQSPGFSIAEQLTGRNFNRTNQSETDDG